MIVAFAFDLHGNKVISWYRIIPLCYIPEQPSREILIVNCGEFISTKKLFSNKKRERESWGIPAIFFLKKKRLFYIEEPTQI